jgi:hypothetical protein
MPYATRDDVFNLGLTARAFVVRGRPVETVDAASGVIRLPAHGLNDEDRVTLEVTSGGQLPTGLSPAQSYGVEYVEFDLLRLRDDNGDPIGSYAEAGEAWKIAVDPLRRLDRHLEAAAARIDESLTAHTPPLAKPYPIHVIEMNARLAARRMLTTLQFENSEYGQAADELNATRAEDVEQLRIWSRGKPLHPRPADQTSTVADNGARAKSGRKPSNWHTGVL